MSHCIFWAQINTPPETAGATKAPASHCFRDICHMMRRLPVCSPERAVTTTLPPMIGCPGLVGAERPEIAIAQDPGLRKSKQSFRDYDSASI
jgi:hypothetical protein